MTLKQPADILRMLEGREKIVLFGDSGCAQLCDVGGILQLEDMEDFLTRHGKRVIGTIFVEGGICDINALRQELVDKMDIIESADALLVQACGVATQTLTQTLPEKESLPATDSLFLGNMPERFRHYEQCALCGECILHLTGGICPIARCAKGILNGPCGGSMNGRCERDSQTECVWQLIYERLKKLGRLDNLRQVWGIKNWGLAHGPRASVRPAE